MNLGKLLAAGKSIMNVRTEVSYRTSKQTYLPKFKSVKNPFKPEATAPVEEDTPSDAPSSAREAPQPSAALGSVMTSQAQPRPVRAANQGAGMDNSGGVAIGQKLPALPALRGKKAGWLKFNPASILRAIPSNVATKPSDGSAKTPKTATQPELSLDSVRVLHNDLSDVDVEVVPIKSRTKTSEPEPQPAKKPLEILGKRLFGTT